MEENNGNRTEAKEKKSIPFIIQLILVVVVVLLLRTFVIGSIYVKGSSMEPNFVHGDVVLINKLAANIGSPDRGDVVICRLHEDDGEENIIKRVIGLPGDELAFVPEEQNGDVFYTLYLNGEKTEEPYINEPMMGAGDVTGTVIVPEDSYFVMGDNRNASTDSRRDSVGPIEKKDLLGKVAVRVYPFDRFGGIR